ncbi:fibroblast growth factor 12 isoform X2 [Hydra vulgaris]|uniref:Fibroblast growth factor 12 isoform X2 n=1 Tax=Hydra vulgaris TaxID=6087 RepID=A0ABM4D6V6_HYDVU
MVFINLKRIQKLRPAHDTMHNLIEQCYDWNHSTGTEIAHIEQECHEKNWKVFTLNDQKTYSKNNQIKAKVTTPIDSCECMKHTKTARRRRLKSQSGYYLAIMPNGQIIGNRDPSSPHIEIDVIPVGADLVKLWAVESELFLMIDDTGQMRGTDVDSTECIFEETLTENFFTVYYSAMYLHKRWCVGLRNKPQIKSFYRKPKPTKDASFFLEIVHLRQSNSSLSDSEDSRLS